MRYFTMETDLNPVPEGGPKAGWISGTPANLASSATTQVYFDLGPDFADYPIAQFTILSSGLSSGLINISFFSSETIATSFNDCRLGNINGSFGTHYASSTTAGGANSVVIRPMGRILRINLTNADVVNAQGSTSKIHLTAYPE